eukprot:TRINITY_DN5300_c0_g3_i1.p1 TRINITY_DN5300_c0_g3~~TRINITY_DN5300_c0_g3_i1.p1  ORF type:complete len:398 (+),score=67.30 TRINITY_DN5300_c0_g3_i1:115-1194(+)
MASSSKGPAALPLIGLRVHPLRPSTVIWAADRFVFSYNLQDGSFEQPRREIHSDAVRAIDAFPTECKTVTRWLSAGDDKEIKLWKEDGGHWAHLSTLGHYKKLTAALFDKSGQAVFADRFGDVYLWDGKEASQAVLLCGHLAIVTAMTFTADGRYLVSADNHEKVRISSYPGCVEIRSICLGHRAQITALGVAAAEGDEAVVSASSDGTLRLWSLDGEQLASHDMGTVVSSLSAVPAAGSISVACGCEATTSSIKMVHFSLKGGEVKVDELVKDEAPQAVCLSSGALLWIDRRGHLRRTPVTEASAAPVDIFEGEDLQPSLVILSKNAGDAEDGGGDDGGEDGGEAGNKGGRGKKRKPQ